MNNFRKTETITCRVLSNNVLQLNYCFQTKILFFKNMKTIMQNFLKLQVKKSLHFAVNPKLTFLRINVLIIETIT